MKPNNTDTPPPAASPDPVARAHERVVEINGQEFRISGGMFSQTAGELAELRSKRGHIVRIAGDPDAAAGEISAQVRALEVKLEALAQAAAAARNERLEAIRALHNAQADELEYRAAALEAKATENEDAVRERRKDLAKIAGCEFVTKLELVRAQRLAGLLDGGTPSMPIFDTLREEAKAFHRRAAEARLQEPNRAGSIEGNSLDDLLATIYSEPARLGPSVESAGAWFEQTAAKERAGRGRVDSGDTFVPVDAPMRFRLTWARGEIVPAESGVFLPGGDSQLTDVVEEDDFMVAPSAAAVGE